MRIIQLSILVFASLTTYAASAEELALDVAAGEKIMLNKYLTHDLTMTTERCLKQAFAKAGYINLTPKLQPELRYLQPGEEATLLAFDYEPALTLAGAPILDMERGASARNFTVFISKRIPRSHTKSIWSDEIPIEDRIQALKSAEAHKKAEQFYVDEILAQFSKLPVKLEDQPAFDRATAKYRDLNHAALEMDQVAPKHRLPPSTEIYLAGSSRTYAVSLAREILHAWGGLTDLPQKPGVDQNNLMGRGAKCILTPKQAQAIVQYRKLGSPRL